jgi:hypothetical protein
MHINKKNTQENTKNTIKTQHSKCKEKKRRKKGRRKLTEKVIRLLTNDFQKGLTNGEITNKCSRK